MTHWSIAARSLEQAVMEGQGPNLTMGRWYTHAAEWVKDAVPYG